MPPIPTCFNRRQAVFVPGRKKKENAVFPPRKQKKREGAMTG